MVDGSTAGELITDPDAISARNVEDNGAQHIVVARDPFDGATGRGGRG